jgi:enoyl-CoA hydratase/carnithine racemase
MTAAPELWDTDERSELVHLDVTDGVATVTLDSPANRNVLSAQLRRALLGHLRTAISDERASCTFYASNMAAKSHRRPCTADEKCNV